MNFNGWLYLMLISCYEVTTYDACFMNSFNAYNYKTWAVCNRKFENKIKHAHHEYRLPPFDIQLIS